MVISRPDAGIYPRAIIRFSAIAVIGLAVLAGPDVRPASGSQLPPQRAPVRTGIKQHSTQELWRILRAAVSPQFNAQSLLIQSHEAVPVPTHGADAIVGLRG